MAQQFSIFWITPLNLGWQYIIGEFFSSGGATLYKNPSDQTVTYLIKKFSRCTKRLFGLKFYRPYTHVDTEGDMDLETFQLQKEDLVDKVYQIIIP